MSAERGNRETPYRCAVGEVLGIIYGIVGEEIYKRREKEMMGCNQKTETGGYTLSMLFANDVPWSITSKGKEKERKKRNDIVWFCHEGDNIVTD